MRSSGTAPPSGLVTLVFTDIEGSTRLVQSLGERWTTLLHKHRDIMRAAWRDWDGFEMGTEGDSFFVSFPSVGDAVAAAVQAQRSLYATEDALAQSEASVTTDLVALYKALGGGWAE